MLDNQEAQEQMVQLELQEQLVQRVMLQRLSQVLL
jgi:hypothetical protein